MKEKLILGMSGGVDSSVAAYLLKKQGYELIGITLNQHQSKTNQDINDAKELAEKLNIEHYVIDICKDFE